MKKIYLKKQLEELKEYLVEVINSIYKIIEIPDANLGGYIIVSENILDIEILKKDKSQGLIPEYTDVIECKKGVNYTSSLFLISSDYAIVVVTTEEGEFPLTGILRCPKCGAGMVTSRTTNKLADGNKKRIAYYACGNWKNKCTTVCNSNTIRADKANKYVFSKLSELLSNEKMVKIIVNNVNKEKVRKVNPAKKDLSKIDNELEKLDKKRAKLFEAPYEFIKSILENFSKVLTERYENVDFEFGKEFNIYISKSISYKVFVSEFEKNILFYEEIKKALQFMKKDFEELIGSRVNFNINEGYFDNSANTINGFKSHELSKKRKSKHK